MPSLDSNPRYRSFVKQRDQELEFFHSKSQQIISDVLRGAFGQVLLIIQSNHAALTAEQNMFRMPQMLKTIDHNIEQLFDQVILPIEQTIKEMRRNSYVMSHAGEVEALGRALGAEKKADINPDVADEQEKRDAEAGGNLIMRIKMYLDKTRRDLMNAINLGATIKDDQASFMARVGRQIPNQVQYKRAPRNLKQVKESVGREKALKFGSGRGRGTPVGGVSMSTGFIDETVWEFMVSDYLEDYIPVNRDPKSIVNVPADAVRLAGNIPAVNEDVWYTWELSRDVSQEFVQSVRDGQIDAARQNGINDFVWISIIDNRTDECCLWRDGLTTREIEARLGTDKSGDKCKAITPPAHFNCRCTLAPVTDELPEAPDVSLGDFQQWLVSG